MRKSALAAAELQRKVGEIKSECVCLVQEPSIYKSKFQNKPIGMRVFPSKFVTENPRAAIFAAPGLKFFELPELEDRDTTVCITKVKGRNIIVASVYLDYNNKDVVTEKLKQVSDFAEENNFPLLLGMDSNCHSTMFGTETNSRGSKLEEFIIENGFKIENIGTTPTFRSSRYETCIDVTLSRDLHQTIKNWRVSDEFNASDHEYILFNIDVGMIEVPEHRNWEKADWVMFEKELAEATFFRPEKMTDCKLDKLVNKLYYVLNAAIDRACPKNKAIRRDPLNEWFTEEIDKQRLKVSGLYKRAMRLERGDEVWTEYKKEYKKYRARVRSSKRKCWNIFKTKCADAKQTSRLTKILQKKEINDISTFTKEDGSSTLPGKETARQLLDAHFPSNTPRKPIRYTHVKAPSYIIEGRFSSWISPELVREALLKFQNKKSPGPDGLKPVIFQYLPDNIINEISFIYKACIDLSFTPTKWREAKVIFIPKPGKADYTKTNAFRPISLSNYLVKGLERLCVWRVDRSLLEFPIHDRQHGFRCDRSTETAISEVTNEIEKHIYKRKRTLGVFLDIRSAFDSISPKHIRRCLLNHRAPETLVEWYYNFISERNIKIELQGSTTEAGVGVGFPQGGVASARFWLIAFNMAVKIINKFGCKGTAFADDCAVLMSGSDPNTLVKNMQKALTEVESWGRKCGLIFNPSKIVAIMFGRRKVWDFKRIKMGGIEIPFLSETKYLGVTLDSKLNWKTHIKNKVEAAKKLIYLVNQAVRGNWGPSPDLSRWALTGIVRPALTYSCLSWANAVRSKGIRKKLDRIDRLGLLAVTQCAPSTPTQALRIIYDVPPCRLLIDKLAVDTVLRYREGMRIDWDGLSRTKKQQKSHLKYLWDIVEGIGVADVRIDAVRVVSPQRKYRIVTDSFLGGRKFLTEKVRFLIQFAF